MKNKSTINMMIDMLMFILMVPIAGIGFLMKYVLVSGTERNILYCNDVDLLYLGLDRHQWGSVHLLLSFILLFLLLLHILLHWKMISHWFKAKVSSPIMRIGISLFFILITVVLGIMPLFLKPEVLVGIKHHAHTPYQHQTILKDTLSVPQQNDGINPSNDSLFNSATLEPKHAPLSDTEHQDHEQHSDINGQMTLQQLSEQYTIPVKELCDHFNIPAQQAEERIGRLRKRYGFSLEDLRTYINNKD